MTFLKQVDTIENPHVEQNFTLFKANNESEVEQHHMVSLSTSSMIWLENILGQGLEQSAAQHRTTKNINYKKLVDLDLTGKIVYLCPISYNYIVTNPTLADVKQLVVTKRVQMDDQLIVLTPPENHNGTLVEYSFCMIPAEELDEKVLAEMKVSIRLHVQSVDGVIYKCEYPEQ